MTDKKESSVLPEWLNNWWAIAAAGVVAAGAVFFGVRYYKRKQYDAKRVEEDKDKNIVMDATKDVYIVTHGQPQYFDTLKQFAIQRCGATEAKLIDGQLDKHGNPGDYVVMLFPPRGTPTRIIVHQIQGIKDSLINNPILQAWAKVDMGTDVLRVPFPST